MVVILKQLRIKKEDKEIIMKILEDFGAELKDEKNGTTDGIWFNGDICAITRIDFYIPRNRLDNLCDLIDKTNIDVILR